MHCPKQPFWPSLLGRTLLQPLSDTPNRRAALTLRHTCVIAAKPGHELVHMPRAAQHEPPYHFIAYTQAQADKRQRLLLQLVFAS
jgi:hypothetical protein